VTARRVMCVGQAAACVLCMSGPEMSGGPSLRYQYDELVLVLIVALVGAVGVVASIGMGRLVGKVVVVGQGHRAHC